MYDDDYYSYLGVSNDASPEQLKKAYRKKLIELHPDTSSHKDGEAVKTLLMIYAILSDPEQRKSYDQSRQYNNKSSDRKSSKTKKDKQYSHTPENYSDAIFVNGIQVIDAYGKTEYVKLGDYIYYEVSPRKKIFFFEYTGKDFYRVKVHKIYSRKRNNFIKKPLFLVQFDDFEQIIFQDDFKKHWFVQRGYEAKDRQQALTTFAVEMSIVLFIMYLILQIK